MEIVTSDLSNESEEVSVRSSLSQNNKRRMENGNDSNESEEISSKSSPSKGSGKRGSYKKKNKITDPEELVAAILEKSRVAKLVGGSDIFSNLGVFFRYKEWMQNVGVGTHLVFVKKQDIVEHILKKKLTMPEFFLQSNARCCGCNTEHGDMFCITCLEVGVKSVWCGSPPCAVNHASINCADDSFLHFFMN
jgi:hypothetical protein